MGNTGNQSIDVATTNSSQGGMHTEAASGSRSDAGNISAGVDAKLEAYLRSMATKGEIEKGKSVLRHAARQGGLPGVGPLSMSAVEAAIANLEHRLHVSAEQASPPGAGMAGSNATRQENQNARHSSVPVPMMVAEPLREHAPESCAGVDASQAPRRWMTTCETSLRQAARTDSPLLRKMSAGQIVTELTAGRRCPGWISIHPRGWISEDALEPMMCVAGQSLASNAGAARERPVTTTARQVLVTTNTIGEAAGEGRVQSSKRPRSPPRQSPQRNLRQRVESTVAQPACNGGDVFVLDALNILKHRNDGSNVTDLDWSQLWTAGRFYKQLGRKVYAFLRHTRQWYDPQIRQMNNELGQPRDEFIIRCPAGACDDEFMILYAKQLEEEDTASSARKRAYIVTNDLFRDHYKEVDSSWVLRHTLKYAFVGGKFVPQAPAE